MQCKECRSELTDENWKKDRRYNRGHWCNSCYKQYHKKYRIDNAETCKLQQRKYYPSGWNTRAGIVTSSSWPRTKKPSPQPGSRLSRLNPAAELLIY